MEVVVVKPDRVPVIVDMPLELKPAEVLRRQEIPPESRLQPRIATTLQNLLSTVNEILQPAIAVATYSVSKVEPARISLANGDGFRGTKLNTYLSQAKEIAAVICTIGPRLEEKVEAFFGLKESLQGFLLDGIGSAVVDVLAREAREYIVRDAQSRGYSASSPLSPGMGDIPISEQKHIFELVPSDLIGVSLTSAEMLVPRKSVSMLIGIGPNMPVWDQIEVCARCAIRDTCHHRVFE
jgi:hypothetical protein